MLELSHYDQWFSSFRSRMVVEVCEYLSIDTSLGKEADASHFLQNLLSSYGFSVSREDFHPDLSTHAAYTSSDTTMCDSNLRAVWRPSAAEGLSEAILFNSHVDVVPADGADYKLFSPYFDDQFIYGRGACDTKGNLFLLLGALAYMEEHGINPKYKILLDLVSGEEVGGNGTLSTIVHGVDADFVVVFEPTDLMVHRGHRGCLTCELELIGKAVHMGGDDHGVSAIKAATVAIREIEALEREMLASARLDPAFEVWKRPLQINVGKIAGGEWPGSVPEKCTLTLNVGFLPGNSICDIENLVRDRIGVALQCMPDIRVSYEFAAGLRNKSYLLSEQDSYLCSLNNAVASATYRSPCPPSYGWRVSCDARHYVHEANVNAVVFGAGSLKDAHSSNEKISIDQMHTGIKSLVIFLSGVGE